MATERNILIHLERLKMYDRGADKAFGAVLFTGTSDKADAADAGFLRPWHWGEVEGFQCAFLDSSGSVIPVPPPPATAPPSPPPPPAPIVSASSWVVTPVATPVSSEDRDRLIQTGDAAFQPSDDGARFIKKIGSIKYSTSDNTVKPWSAMLSRLSSVTYPYSAPLKLRYQFMVRVPDNTAYILATPIIKAKNSAGELFPDARLVPGATMDAIANPGGAKLSERTWAYPVAPKVVASMLPCSLDPREIPHQEGFIDFGTLWVQSGAAAVYPDDWRASVEAKMALALDVAQPIGDYLLSHSDTGDKDVALLTDMALASIRDQLAIGTNPRPDGGSLINLLLATLNSQAPNVLGKAIPQIPKDELDRLTLLDRALFPTVKDWTSWLVSLGLPELSRLGLLSGTPAGAQDAGAQLQNLYSLLFGGSPDLLARVYVELWRKSKAVPAPYTQAPYAKDDWAQVLAAIPSCTASVSFRQHLALSLLGLFWRDLLKDSWADTADVVSTRFGPFVALFFNGRYRLNGATALAPPPPDAGGQPLLPAVDAGSIGPRQDVINAVAAWTAKNVAGFKPAVVSDKPKEAQAMRALATTMPHGLSVQVGRPVGLPKDRDPGVNPSDVLNHISGIGAFVRPKTTPTSKWRCLNIAKTAVINPDGAEKDPIPLAKGAPSFVPARVGYVNDLRQVLVTYNNAPLVGDSPLTQKGITQGQLDGGSADQQNPLISHPYALGPAAQIPGLRFGSEYEFAFFAVSNSGALPKGVGRKISANNYSPVDLVDLIKNQPEVPDAGVIVTVPYRRRVPIGQMRIFNMGESDIAEPGKLKLPLIPDTVHPRARETGVKTDLMGLTPDQVTSDTPLLLLAPKSMIDLNSNLQGRDSLTFEFGIPSTDRETWHRWVFAPSDDPKVRQPRADWEAKFLAEFYKRAHKQNGVNNRMNIDDPALLRSGEGNFLALLEKLDSGRFTPVKGSDGKVGIWLNAKQPAPDGMAAFQRRPLRAYCIADGMETVAAEQDPDPDRKGLQRLAVHVAKGGVYRLSIYNCIAQTDLESRFEFDAASGETVFAHWKKGDLGITADGPAVYLVSPFQIMIEVATEELPANDLLFNRFACNYDPKEYALVAQATAANAAEFQHLYRMEVVRQVWRWKGREVPAHPALETAPALTTSAWEALEIGEVAESDHIFYPMDQMRNDRGEKIPSFRYREQLGGDNKQGDRRGLHYRFGVRAYSRYEGWLPDANASVLGSASAATAGPLGVDPGTIWYPKFVPSRPKTPIPAPKVRLIFPLTEGYEGSFAGSPGMLLVLDEPWYEVGGLGEKLAVTMELTADPNNDPKDNKIFYYEAGPDPIYAPQPGDTVKALSPQAADTKPSPLDPSHVDFGAKAEFPSERIRGPVGHTVKPGNVSPLFTASSFLIPAPAITGRQDLRWYFCKLKLQRLVQLDKNGTQLASGFTDPYWVQFLPEFSVYDGLPDLSGVRVRMIDGTNAELIGRNNVRQIPRPTPTPGNSTLLYLLLTRRVFDIIGRPDQEVFVGILKQAGETWVGDEPALIGDTLQRVGNSIRARIVEVQIPTGKAAQAPPAKAKDFWLKLFPEPAKDPAAMPEPDARIVRVSRPVESIGAAMAACAGAN
jgi:hypothetical protein